ncbi:ABC transporter permease subunit [Neobacillus sp. NPDC093127]|uniref:ABC transporter permease subunit n=1 Tax=Neobacillus sp. NPDC093127 TaxID=3364296 RepID=UPI00383014F3
MKRLISALFRIALVLSGFLFIFNLPLILGIGVDSVEIHFDQFWEVVKNNLQFLFQIRDDMYLSLFKQLDITGSYQYTMSILIISLTSIILIAMVTMILIMMAPEKVRNFMKNGVNFFEAVPDLLIIFLFQFFVITLYKATGFKFLRLYGVFGVKPYFIPIITVSFLPLFLLLQFLIQVITEEQNQLYVQYVKAKGIGRLRTLLVHMIRNILPLIVLQLRTVIWVLLSNIYLVEYMFNINGFTKQFVIIIYQGGDFASLVACLLMLSLPLLVIEAAGWLVSKRIKGTEAVSL